MNNDKLSRREFLCAATMTAVGAALIACQPKTVVVEEVVEEEKVVEETIVTEEEGDTEMENSTANAIPKEVALQLCEEICEENRGKLYTFNGLWCWGCVTFSKGDPTKMCWHSPPDNRGCGQVNARYAQQSQPTEQEP